MANLLDVGRMFGGPPRRGGELESIEGTLCRVPELWHPSPASSHPHSCRLCSQEILSACWAFDLQERPSFPLLMDMLEKLPKLNRRLSHPGHFWKSAEL